MNKRQEKVCHLLAEYGRAEILKWFKPDSCIASTKVAMKVLSHFKIPARPKCFTLEIMNPVYRELFDKHGHPQKEQAEEWLAQGAWEVIISDHNGEIGHVVAIADEQFLIDLSLDQASRPQKQMELEPACAPLPAGWKREPLLVYENENNVRLIYHPVDNEMFRVSNDWREGYRTTPVAKQVIAKITRKL